MKPSALRACYYMGSKAHHRHLILPALRPLLRGATDFREPFVGSGAISLAVMSEFPHLKYWLNDRDAAIACLWWSLRNRASDLIEMVDAFTPSVDEFYRCKAETQGVVNCPTIPDQIVRVGFAKLVRHQLSYSGYGCGARGGKDEILSLPAHRIAARWNSEKIKEQFRLIGNRLNRCDVKITAYVWERLFEDEDCRAVQFVDPPYLLDRAEYNQFYECQFTDADHERLAVRLASTTHAWVATLGDHYRVWELYNWAHVERVARRLLRLTPTRA
jgi:DNA adenine methylase